MADKCLPGYEDVPDPPPLVPNPPILHDRPIMPILLRNLTLVLDEPESSLPHKAARRLRIAAAEIQRWTILRRALDARKHDQLAYVYNLEITLAGGEKAERQLVRRVHRDDVTSATPPVEEPLVPGTIPMPGRPVIVGFGPAGMFAALWLARHGYRPLVLERGQGVQTRHRDILQRFYRQHDFDPESNLLYGEGGAGAYSDGKLYTRLNDARLRRIMEIFVEHGAPRDILIDARPHLGSDRIPTICQRIRDAIIRQGGEIRFGARLDGLDVRDGVLRSIRVGDQSLEVGPLLLGVGHSARDTIRMVAAAGVALAAKPFQLGVRVEHPQSLVDQWQYGRLCGHGDLPPAEYHLIAKRAAASGDVYSFCMCPGGEILPTNESPGLIATNGASRVRRAGPFANSGLVLTILPDTIDNDPLKGLNYLEHWERVAFDLTGKTYELPCQRPSDYLGGRSSDGQLHTSYPLGGRFVDVRQVLPPHVAEAIAVALRSLNARCPGFAGPDGMVTGPETRASSAVRMSRDPDTRQSISVAGLYPIGEGAGYAGGIMSAALDGIMTAEHVIRQFAPAK